MVAISYAVALGLELAIASALTISDDPRIPDADSYLNSSFGNYQMPANGIIPGDDCKGSAGCSGWSPFFHHTPTADDCLNAYLKFDDYEFYEKQSCTYNHCTAIFECDNINYAPPIAIQGFFVKDEFNVILNKFNNSCTNCGSHYFGEPHGRCRVTLNYCNWVCAEIPNKCTIRNGLSATNGTASNATATNQTIQYSKDTVLISNSSQWEELYDNGQLGPIAPEPVSTYSAMRLIPTGATS